MEDLLEFREAHIVSDLHLGGDSGFQIFDQGVPFQKFVGQLAKSPAGPVALVINGDLVDFLAEPGATYFDATSALRKLGRIASDKAFSPVFDALREFVKAPDRLLAITLGNHDIELALPSCREGLLRTLSEGDAAARGRILLSLEGAGFRCRVGDAVVLCLHGNEVDPWNVTDYETLRRMCRDSWSDREGVRKKWIPNAGTQLVIEVMNSLKRHYRWIDLLKPERDAVPDVLLALDGGQEVKIAHILDGLDSYRRRVADAIKMRFHLLGEEELPAEPLPGLDHTPAASTPIGAESEETKKLLWKAQERFVKGTEDPYRVALADAAGDYLSVTGIARQLWRRFVGDDPVEALRKGLQGLRDDRSFDWKEPDATAKEMDAYIGPEVDYLVAGHTHLRRALQRTRGTGWYYNSGTWANLMRLDPKKLKDTESFRPIAGRLMARKEVALAEDLIHRIPTVVSIVSNDGKTFGELRDVQKDGSCKPVTGTRFPSP